ncbi:MAG: carboxypeptidase regulatory-like domain-containing protein [Vicinamibacterales bacterium]
MKRAVLALLSAAILFPASLAAQAVTGTILGTVHDNTGGILPGATVTLTHTETGRARTIVSDSAGQFTVPSLPTGTYTLSAELPGFKGVSIPDIRLGVDQRLRFTVTLEVGAVAETITVTGISPLVQTSSSELGTTVDEQQIQQLPLNGRNFVSLTRTVPGVVRGIPGANIDGAGSLAWRASASFSANGQRPRDNNYILDGVDNNETWLQTVVVFPAVDSLDEFKLQTSTYSAEFGRSLGGVVNLQIKSGSNSVKGSGYEFLRNDAFDANNFFNNRAGRAKPDFSQHQFGGTLGGPVLRSKTFFFASYQGYRVSQGQTFLSTVPSERMRRGDFGEVNRVIYDPLTGQPFPGNQIPLSRWDPAARNIIEQLYPPSNIAGERGATGQTINNYLINPTLERDDNQIDSKVDHNLSANNRFFVRYSYQKTHRFLPATLPHGDAGFTFGAGDGNIKAQGLAVNDTHTFGTGWLNEFRVGWTSIKFFMTPIDYGQNLAQSAGIPGINLNTATSALSQIVFQNGGARNLGSNGNQPLITNQNDYQIFNNVTRVAGRHAIKAGGSVTMRSREILNADLIVGQFGFHQNGTSSCAGITVGCTPLANTGFDVASFALGYAAIKDRRLFDANTYTETRPEIAVYVQDDMRIGDRLTVNAGLRWDLFVPWVEIDDRQSNFDESTGKFVVASPDAVINGVKVGRHLQTYSKRDFGPRFGAAYDLMGDGRTLIRGGYGIFWNFSPGGTSSSKAQNPPFLQSTTLTTTFGTNLRLADGLPPPPGVDPNREPAGTTRSVFDINFRDAYAHNFNLNVQRQLGSLYMVEVAYAGSRGRQLPLKGDPNQPRATLGVTDNNVNRPYIRVSPQLRTVGQLRSEGFVDYNGLLVKFQRRYANNFSTLTSYTFARAEDYNSDNDGTVTLANVYDKEYDRAPAQYDVTHTLSSTVIYELPWAKEKIYGGWQVNGVVYLRSGLPLNITTTQNVLSTTVGTTARPNQTCSGELANPTIDRWFDTSCFVNVTENTATYGNARRNSVRGPGQVNIDASLIKNTRLGRFDTEFRIEAFNLFNHAQFAQPNGQLGNPSFGVINAMLASPSCAFCGTIERQVQIAAKVKF